MHPLVDQGFRFASEKTNKHALLVVVELVDPNYRPMFSMASGVFYNASGCLLPLLASLVRDYQKLLTIYASISCLFIIYFW